MNMKRASKKRSAVNLILTMLFLVSILGFASATDIFPCEYNVSVDYAYGSSGINIAPAGTTDWIPTPIVLNQAENYTMKAAVKNNLEEDAQGVHIIFKLDETILGEFDRTINTVTRPDLDFDISELECNSTHTVSVEVQFEGDCGGGDNFASIDILIFCENGEVPQPVCGNEILENSEECDDGNNANGDGCDSECLIEEQEEPETPSEGNGGAVGIGVDITTEDFEPMVWMCDDRIVLDDNTEPGRDMMICGGEEISGSYTEEDFSSDIFDINADISEDEDNVIWTVEMSEIAGHWSTGTQIVIGDGTNPLFTIGWSPGESISSPTYKEYSGGWGSATTTLPAGMSVSGNYNEEYYIITIPKSYLGECGDDFYWALNVEASFAGPSGSKNYQENFPADWVRWTGTNMKQESLGELTAGEELLERINNYAFEGEQIAWTVLVMDKNGVEKIEDVFVTIGDAQSNGGGTGTVTRTGTVTSCDSIPSTNTNWANNLVLNKFDDSLGTLVSAEIELNTEMVNSINIQNEDIGPIIVTLNSNGAVNINPLDGPTVTSIISVSEDFVANQGSNIFNVSDADSENYVATNLGMYIAGIGDTTFNLPADASATAQLSGSGNFVGGVSTQASAQACVTYTYEYEVTIPTGNDIEVNCYRNSDYDDFESCNARIGEEELTDVILEDLADYFTCEFTVETPESMYGEYWITVEALDLDGLSGTMDEEEYWYLNPEIALAIEGDLTFEDVRPGTSSYSDTLLITNDADDGSGVMLDMFISGTDFYDSSSSGARCSTTNQLSLDAFGYYAVNGAYSTRDDLRLLDAEGYVGIEYGIGFNDPNPFYNNNEILQAQQQGPYYTANILAPGADMALTFRLNLPEPCNGDFDTGSIFFWGEAI